MIEALYLAASVCVSPETMQLGLRHYGAPREMRIDGPAAALFVERFNAIEFAPPDPDVEAETVIIVPLSHYPAVEIAFFHEGCMLPQMAYLHIEAFDRIMPGA